MGRGSSGAGGNLGRGSGGVNPANIKNERDLLSDSKISKADANDVLTTARDIHDEYGVDVGQFMLAEVVGKDSNTLAYSDGTDIGFNSKYFKGANMEGAYKACVDSGFHPSNGNKTAMQAVASHEFGHVLTEQAAKKLSLGDMHDAAKIIVDRATAKAGHKGSKSLAKKISGYAGHSNAECVAEAVADVYCNGKKASAESRAIVSELKSNLK